MDGVNIADVLAEQKVLTVLQEILKSFPDKFESPLDKSKLRFAIATAFVNLSLKDKPIRESVFSPNYITNVRPDGDLNGYLNVDIYKNPNGGYDVSLSIYDIQGDGPMSTSKPLYRGAAIPLEQINIEYIKDKVSGLPDEQVNKFIEKIKNKIQEKETQGSENLQEKPLRERIKNVIRKKLSEVQK